ncbi:MAG: AMP-binding protein, partial [Micromonosporaceae bacterium]|nr:AMP-binding protein [Micromonosporaceae bacterium]
MRDVGRIRRGVPRVAAAVAGRGRGRGWSGRRLHRDRLHVATAGDPRRPARRGLRLVGDHGDVRLRGRDARQLGDARSAARTARGGGVPRPCRPRRRGVPGAASGPPGFRRRATCSGPRHCYAIGDTVPKPALCRGEPLRFTAGFPRSLPQALVRAAERFPDAGVVTIDQSGGTESLGYPALLDRARRILRGLREENARPGDYAIVHSADPGHFFTAYWACVLGGVRPLLVARPSDPASAAAAVARLRQAAPLLDRPVVLGGAEDLSSLDDSGLRLLDVAGCRDHPPVLEIHRPDDADVAMLLMSSGSTGAPKLVQLTHRGLTEFAAGTPAMLPISPGQVTLNWLPLDHSGAFLLYHLLEVYLGCTNIHAATDRVLADPLRWLDLMAEHRVHHSWSPNFGYRLVAAALREAPDRGWDLSAVRTLVSGGEQITVPVMEEFLAAVEPFGVARGAFAPAWGMTETCTGITFGRYDDPGAVHRLDDQVTLVGVGSPAPGAALRVVDEQLRVLPEGKIGRLQVNSARVTAGYLGNPEADRTAFPDGDWPPRTWFDTGDLALVAEGQVVIAGRPSDRIILNGQNHHAYSIEEVAAQAPGVTPGLVAACGLPDPASGTERLAVCFGTDAADPADPARCVQELLYTRLGLTAQVTAVPAGEFPRTAGGKVQRSVLRKRLLTGDLAAAPPAEPGGVAGSGAVRLRQVVRDTVQAFVEAPIDERARFYELGVDSVTIVRLHQRLQDELGRRFPRSAMFEHSSVAALAEHLAGLGAGRRSAGPVGKAGAGAGGRIAVIGMAARFPGASTLEDYWANLRDGVRSVRRFSAEELAAAGTPAEAPGFVPVSGALSDIDSFDARFFGMSAREAELTDPAQRLFLECCHHALEHGGYAATGGPERIGVFAGSGMNLYTHQSYLLNNLRGMEDDPVTGMQTAIGNQPDFLATRVAYRLGLTGPAVGVQTACSTSLVAVHLACQALLAGDADLALAGAAAVHVPRVTGYRHFPGSILSPSGECRAFDADADGTVGGNGVAAALLKPLDRALADGDTVHAVILGSAVNNDGGGKVGFTAPGVAGQVDAVVRAMDRAGVPAETISYLEAHGTGTQLGDPIEFRALSQAMRGRTGRVGFCTLGSVKPNIGHLDSCAGMAGLIKAVLMLRHRTLVPLVNFQRPNPELDLAESPFVIGVRPRPWDTGGVPRRAGVNALGVGGTNAHVILEEAPPAPTPAADFSGPAVLPLSAADPVALEELRVRVRDHLRSHPDLRPSDLVATAGAGRPHLRHRLAVAGDTVAELAGALDVADVVEAPADPGPLGFGFTGQGAARPGMADELYARFPVFRRVLDEAEEACRKLGGGGLLALLCGRHESDRPWPTDTAQPASFAFQAALVEHWRGYGVTPDFLVGHSIGEYAALHTAGAFSLADGVRLATIRGELTQSGTPAGAMVSVLADENTVGELIAETGVEIAAFNGPSEYVLTGPEAEMRQVLTRLDRAGGSWRRLPVDRAFHSALLDPVLDEFARR